MRKGKDEKKIKELMDTMKVSGKPLPLQLINELRMLEMMSSPYSQPLKGMIKQIEAELTKRQDRDKSEKERPSSKATKKSVNQFSKTDDLTSR